MKSTRLGGLHKCPVWEKKGILGKYVIRKQSLGRAGMVMEVHIEVDPKEIYYGCWNQLFAGWGLLSVVGFQWGGI